MMNADREGQKNFMENRSFDPRKAAASVGKRSESRLKKAVCTAVSANYWAYARVLAGTLKRYHPELEIFVLLVDRPHPSLPLDKEPFRTVFIEELDNLPDRKNMFFKYDALELNTAVKPYFFEYLMRRYGIEKLIFCDPDIAFFSPLDSLWKLLETHPIILTPHITAPYNDREWPSELHVNQSGIFNLGFLGLANSGSTMPFLKWWQEKLYDGCYMDIQKGMHVDQKWVNFVPVFYPDAFILRDPRYNAAYWNLHERGNTLRYEQGRLTLGEKPVVFFHFSGFDYGDPALLSRHQNRFSFSNLPNLKPLFDFYRRELSSAGYSGFSHLPYAFGVFDNGMKISGVIRSLYRKHEALASKFEDPFHAGKPGCFFDFMLSPEKHGSRVSRILKSVYASRPDLQAAFPDNEGADQAAFLRWAESSGLKEYGHPLTAGAAKPISFAGKLLERGLFEKRLFFFKAGGRLARMFAKHKSRRLPAASFEILSKENAAGVNIVREDKGSEQLCAELINVFYESAVLVRVFPSIDEAFSALHSYPITLVLNPRTALHAKAASKHYSIAVLSGGGVENSLSNLETYHEIWTLNRSAYQSLAPRLEIPVLLTSPADASILQEGTSRRNLHPSAERLKTIYNGFSSRPRRNFLLRRCLFRTWHIILSIWSFCCNWIRLSLLIRKLRRKTPWKKIAAISRTEHFGDIVAAEPLLRRVRLEQPNAFLVAFVKRGYREIVEHHPCLDSIISVHCVSSWNWLSRTLPFDFIYDLHFDDLRCQDCGIPLRKRNQYSCVGMSNYYHFGNLLSAFSLTSGMEPLNEKPKVFIPDFVAKGIDRYFLPAQFVVIHGRSNDRAREWEPEKWKAFYQHIKNDYGLTLIEVGLTSVFEEPDLPGKINLCGKLTLLETAEVMRRASLFVGIDSGPAHLANALGIPALIMLGKFLNFEEYTPYSGLEEPENRLKIIRSSGSASTIETEEVFSALRSMLGPSERLLSERSLNE